MKNKFFSTIISTLIILLSICCSGFAIYSASDRLILSEPFIVNNGTISYNDIQWYKVNYLEDDKPYLITVCCPDGTEKLLTASYSDHEDCIWNYERKTITSSTNPPHSTLMTSEYDYLMCYDDEIAMKWYAYTDSASTWKYENGYLYYTSSGNNYYIKQDDNSSTGLGYANNAEQADKVNIYTHGTRLGKCIEQQPKSESYVIAGSGYKAPEYYVSVSDNTEVDSVMWFVDDKPYKTDSLVFKADMLTDKQAGLHRIKCTIEGHDSENTHYRETSAAASFIIANGVIPDSFMTFSDMHEEFDLIGDAIETVMDENDGLIPSLIVCTGDWVNGPSGDYERVMNQFYHRFIAQFGGIDAVFVAGNHDNGEAASEMSMLAGLGAEINAENNNGVIFSGKSDGTDNNGKSSKFGKNLLVYGINYQACAKTDGYSRSYDYAPVIDSIEKFLDDTSKSYNGELIVISAHSGLHILGVQPESVNTDNQSLSDWAGDAAYNINNSDELVSVINRYASEYDMNIIYLFGHNHSRKETEMFLTDGDTLVSPHTYSPKKRISQLLSFTYAHSGYLSSEIGCADRNFSLIKYDGGKYTYDLMKVGEGTVRHEEIASKYTVPEPVITTSVTTTALTTTSSASSTTAKASSDSTSSTVQTTTSVKTTSRSENSPLTSDNSNSICLFAFGTAVLILIKSRNKSTK